MVRAFAQGAMCRRIDPSWGGPIEIFLVPASAPRLLTIAVNRKEQPMWRQRVSYHYVSGTLRNVRRHITVNKMC